MRAEAVERAAVTRAGRRIARQTHVELVPALVMDVPELHGIAASVRADELRVDRHGRRRGVASKHVVAEYPARNRIERADDRDRRRRTHEHPRLVGAAKRTVRKPRDAVAEEQPVRRARERGLGVLAVNRPADGVDERAQRWPVVRRSSGPFHLVRP